MVYYADDESARAHKTGRVLILAGLAAILGLFYFLYKTDSCSNKPENCRDVFHEFINDNLNHTYDCPAGAIAEPVTQPRQGIFCHCPTAASAPPANPPQ